MPYLIFTFILGAVVGSFLNLCIHRLPRGESIIYPASHCPHCNHRLNGIDLIPLFGYFFLGGKCRYCGVRIPFRYPAVELIAGTLFVGVAVKFPLAEFPLEFFFYLLFSSLLIIIFFTDLEEQVIPDGVSITGISAGLVFNLLKGIFFAQGMTLSPFFSAVLGMLLGYSFFYLVARAGRRLFGKEVMGEGDFYLAALLGAYLGWQGAVFAILLAYLLAGIVALPFLLLGKIKMKSYVPFGPALAVGGVLSMFFGRQIANWYLGLFL